MLSQHPEINEVDDKLYLFIEVAFQASVGIVMLKGALVEYNPVSEEVYIDKLNLSVSAKNLSKRTLNTFRKNNYRIREEKIKRLIISKEITIGEREIDDLIAENVYLKLEKEGYILDDAEYISVKIKRDELVKKETFPDMEEVYSKFYVEGVSSTAMAKTNYFKGENTISKVLLFRFVYENYDLIYSYYYRKYIDYLLKSVKPVRINRDKLNHLEKTIDGIGMKRVGLALGEIIWGSNCKKIHTKINVVKNQDYKLKINLCFLNPFIVKAYKSSIDIYRTEIDGFKRTWTGDKIQDYYINRFYSYIENGMNAFELAMRGMMVIEASAKAGINNSAYYRFVRGEVKLEEIPKQLKRWEKLRRPLAVSNLKNLTEKELVERFKCTEDELHFFKASGLSLEELLVEAVKEYDGEPSIFDKLKDLDEIEADTPEGFITKYYKENFRIPEKDEIPGDIYEKLLNQYGSWQTAWQVNKGIPKEVKKELHLNKMYPKENYLKMIKKEIEVTGKTKFGARELHHGSKIKKIFGSIDAAVEEAIKIGG